MGPDQYELGQLEIYWLSSFRYAIDRKIETSGPVMKVTTQRVAFCVRLLITALLVTLVASRLDLVIVISELRSAGGVALVTASAILVVQVVLLAYRWLRILSVSGITMLFRHSLCIVLIGLFFNQCLPTSLGGDGVRVLMLRSGGVPLERAINAVLVDRLSGVAALLPLLVLGVPFIFAWTPSPFLRLADLAMTGVFFAGLAMYFLCDRLIVRIRPLGRLGPFRAVAAASAYARNVAWQSAGAVGIGALALMVHLSSVLLVAVLAIAFRSPIGPGAAIVLVPPILGSALLPISYGGWGARELAMIASLGLAGVPATTALALSITVGVLALISTLPGAVLWLRADQLQRSVLRLNCGSPLSCRVKRLKV